MPNPQLGTILGAYRVEGTIGAGSMGEVFRGIDTGLNRKVAIKILSEKHRDSSELRARFVREGRAVAAISHPNVVQVFATGQFDERPYIAMELLDGTDLGSMVEKNGPLDSLAAAQVILDAAQGLAAAAKAGLIHRDVKPSNLVRLSDGRVKVTDFGLAKPVDPGAEPALTAMGVVVGTPDYIAPEQARGEPIDERVDIYALGGTLYFLLTGIPPFRTGKPAEDKYLKVVARHLRNPAPDAATTNPDVDRELSNLTRAMMAKKAADRPSYDDLVDQLAHIVARLDPSAAPRLAAASRDRSRPIALPPNVSRGGMRSDAAPAVSDASLDQLPERAIPAWVLFFTLACVGLFATGLVMYMQKGGEAQAPATNPPAPAPATTVDAAVTTVTPDALDTPAGMLLVTMKTGEKLLVDARPISLDNYRAVFAKHDQPGKPDDAAVNISYTEAKSYALTKGRRLLTSAEWDAAAVTAGFVVADGRWEWVDSPDEKKKTVRQHGSKAQTRTDAKAADVTFRTAKSL
ncbi:MAG: bifunctional serine/threonine-protein kinase/formylglycine-generating enzyme family protein [Kofleriaceae bacterium]|nr:bifunctional serine/threonine-protein kinase/formylglycine-generating enzyme family protein [Kofleriaceae bacterium]